MFRVCGEGKASLFFLMILRPPSSSPLPPTTPLCSPPPPPPSARKSATQTQKKTALCAPASTQEVRNPKIGQQLGAQPTPRFRGMLDALLDAMFDPLPPFTFCCPQAIVDEDAGV